MAIIYYGWNYNYNETPPQLKLETGFLDWWEVYAVKLGLIAPPKTADCQVKFDYLDKVRSSANKSGISIGFKTINRSRRYYIAVVDSIKWSDEKPTDLAELFKVDEKKLTKWDVMLGDFCKIMDIPAQHPSWYLFGDYEEEYLPQGGH